MNKKSLGLRRAVVLLAMGGATFGMFTTSFGPFGGGQGCNYATFGNYDAMFGAAGDAVIDAVSQNYFSYGTDWDNVVRVPTTAFARNVWNNWLDARIPDDLPNNGVPAR